MARALVLAVVLLLVAQAFAGLDPTDLPRIWTLTDGEDKGIGAGFDVVDDTKHIPWLFKYDYSSGKTVSVGGQNFAIPDGLSATSVHKYIGFNETRLTTTWNDFYETSLKTTSITASLKYENISLNAGFQSTKGYINHLTKNGTRNFAFNGGVYLTFGIQFRGTRYPPFDDYFAEDIQALPAAYDALAYGRFIRAYGTHFFTRVNYGCQYNITVSLDKKFAEQTSVKWATTQMDLTLKYNEFNLGLNSSRQVNKTEIDQKVQDDALVHTNAQGGDELLFTTDKNFSAWLESCRTLKAPILMYSDVEPLPNLIDDPAKKANLKQAIKEYGTTGIYPGH